MAQPKTNDSAGVDHYLAALPIEQQNALERIRQIIKKNVPEVQEFLSYKMPAFHYNGMIGGFAAFKNHCSFFPWDSKTIAVFQDELSDFKTSKGAIQFTLEKPLTEELIQKMVLYKVNDNLNKLKK